MAPATIPLELADLDNRLLTSLLYSPPVAKRIYSSNEGLVDFPFSAQPVLGRMALSVAVLRGRAKAGLQSRRGYGSLIRIIGRLTIGEGGEEAGRLSGLFVIIGLIIFT